MTAADAMRLMAVVRRLPRGPGRAAVELAIHEVRATDAERERAAVRLEDDLDAAREALASLGQLAEERRQQLERAQLRPQPVRDLLDYAEATIAALRADVQRLEAALLAQARQALDDYQETP